jgi:hypothetical protein
MCAVVAIYHKGNFIYRTVGPVKTGIFSIAWGSVVPAHARCVTDVRGSYVFTLEASSSVPFGQDCFVDGSKDLQTVDRRNPRRIARFPARAAKIAAGLVFSTSVPS